jgi:hypothetical protein
MNAMLFQRAPLWAERTAPRLLLRRDLLSILLISRPDADCYVVANLEETDAIADPRSGMGMALRSYSALLCLSYAFSN